MEASCCSSEFTRNVWQAAAGRLAATILIQTTALSSKRVDIIFDTYEMPSIKRMERERRSTCDRNYNIIGPQQTRPVDFNEALKSPSFKTELPTFLLNEWKEQVYAHIIHERHVYVGHLGECLHFFVGDGVVRHDTIDVGPTGFQPRRSRHPHLPPSQGHRRCWKRQQHHHKRASDTAIVVIMLHHLVGYGLKLFELNRMIRDMYWPI